MASVTPQEFSQAWAEGLQSKGEKIRRGVEKVTVAPTKLAAAKQQKMLQNLTAAVTSGKWAASLNKVTLEEWKAAMLELGVPRLQQAASSERVKRNVEEFATQFLPFLDSAVAKVKAMPDLTIEDAIARSATMIREMSKFNKR